MEKKKFELRLERTHLEESAGNSLPNSKELHRASSAKDESLFCSASDALTHGCIAETHAFQPTRRRSMVILAKYGEDTTWSTGLSERCGVDIRTYQSKNRSSSFYVPNFGGEAGKYLTAILDLYDDPPPYTLFIHAHNTSWHNEIPASEYICSNTWRNNDVKSDTNIMRGFEKKNFVQFPSTRTIRVVKGKKGKIDAVFIADKEKRKWFATNNLRARVSIAMRVNRLNLNVAYYDSECCSQFAISSGSMRRRSKQFYTRMKRWTMSKGDSIKSNKGTQKPTVEKVKGLEPLWALIFDVVPLKFSAKLGSGGSFAKEVAKAKAAGRG